MFRFRSNTFTLTCFLAIAFALTACSGLTQSDRPALKVWWLQPVSGAPRADDSSTAVPVILDLKVVPGLDSNQVLALSSDAQLIPYAGARWADYLPELVASLINRSLQASGHFAVLQERTRNGASACELRLELTEFFADLDSGGRTRGVSVDIGGHFRCGASGTRELGSRAYVGVDAEQMNAIVAAFQKALDQVTLDLIHQMNTKQ